MFQKLGDALRRFMYGRYGADSLNKWLLIFAVILILLGSLGSRYLAPWMAAFNTLAYVALIWSLFRMYSRNIEARRRENAAGKNILIFRYFLRLHLDIDCKINSNIFFQILFNFFATGMCG